MVKRVMICPVLSPVLTYLVVFIAVSKWRVSGTWLVNWSIQSALCIIAWDLAIFYPDSLENGKVLSWELTIISLALARTTEVVPTNSCLWSLSSIYISTSPLDEMYNFPRRPLARDVTPAQTASVSRCPSWWRSSPLPCQHSGRRCKPSWGRY